MKRVFPVAIVMAVAFAPAVAGAGERVNEMALGAASGALVAGPVGLVAGGIIGYVAGPDIGRGLGLKHHHIDRNRSTAGRRNERPVTYAPPARLSPTPTESRLFRHAGAPIEWFHGIGRLAARKILRTARFTS
jgi:hypothetical protein